jgi:hypothetical protein
MTDEQYNVMLNKFKGLEDIAMIEVLLWAYLIVVTTTILIKVW